MQRLRVSEGLLAGTSCNAQPHTKEVSSGSGPAETENEGTAVEVRVMNGITDGEQTPVNGLPIGRDRDQLDFAVRMMKRYLAEKGVRTVGVRRLHYFIVIPSGKRTDHARKIRSASL